MSNRIDQCFESLRIRSKKALVPFITVGDPHPDWTVSVMHALVTAGADLIELGVPFSDPMADGPVIQAASERAISKGVSLHHVLETVRAFREKDDQTPVVLMGYMNPIERYGYTEFSTDAAKVGIDGVLMVDCPPEEMSGLDESLDQNGIYPICLLAPTTTPDRMAKIARAAKGYLYYVTFKGITGANQFEQSDIVEPLKSIRSYTTLPVAVGFGIKTPESAAMAAKAADAVVIGSALVETLSHAESLENAVQAATDFLAPVRKAMDNGQN